MTRAVKKKCRFGLQNIHLNMQIWTSELHFHAKYAYNTQNQYGYHFTAFGKCIQNITLSWLFDCTLQPNSKILMKRGRDWETHQYIFIHNNSIFFELGCSLAKRSSWFSSNDSFTRPYKFCSIRTHLIFNSSNRPTLEISITLKEVSFSSIDGRTCTSAIFVSQKIYITMKFTSIDYATQPSSPKRPFSWLFMKIIFSISLIHSIIDSLTSLYFVQTVLKKTKNKFLL